MRCTSLPAELELRRSHAFDVLHGQTRLGNLNIFEPGRIIYKDLGVDDRIATLLYTRGNMAGNPVGPEPDQMQLKVSSSPQK